MGDLDAEAKDDRDELDDLQIFIGRVPTDQPIRDSWRPVPGRRRGAQGG